MASTLCFLVLLVTPFFGEAYNSYKSPQGEFKFHFIPQPWTDAVLRCQLEGGILASPTTADMTANITLLMARMLDSDNVVHTGIHDSYYRGVFFSYEGIPLSYDQYKEVLWQSMSYYQPNSLVMYRNGTLMAVPRTEAHPYICYIKDNNHTKTINECDTTDDAYSLDSRTGSCYKFHHNQLVWSEAFLTCANEGAHLVIVNGETEAQVIRELFVKNDGYPRTSNKELAFAGFTVWSEREWYTIHGQTLDEAGYHKFAKGEPNNLYYREYCGSISSQGLLYDDSCDQETVFICEKNMYPVEGIITTSTAPPESYDLTDTETPELDSRLLYEVIKEREDLSSLTPL